MDGENDEAAKAAEGAAQEAGQGGEGAPAPTDYEAKYRAAIKHSREWERRAKANEAAASELEKLKEEDMTEAEKLRKQLDEAEAKAAALESERERAEWAAQVARETGITPDQAAAIRADSLEELRERAALFAPAAAPAGADGAAQGMPVVLGDGERSAHRAPRSPEADFAAFMDGVFGKRK